MLYETVPLLLTNFLAILMVIIVLLSRSVRKNLRYTLIFTILSLLLWQDTIFIADNVTENLTLWNTIIFIWPGAATISCFAFIRALHKDQSSRNEKSKFTPLIIVSSLVQLIPIVTFHIFTSVKVIEGELVLNRDFGYYIYLIGIVAALSFLVAEIIIRRARSAHRALERYAINVVLVTVIVASSYGVLMNVIVPLVTDDQSLIAWGILIVDIFAIGLSLSIARGRLLDIRFYAIRTTVYILSLATLAIVYSILAYLLSQWVLGYGASSAQSILNVVLALILAFIFQPIRHFFDRVTNRIFFRDEYSSDAFFSQLNRELTTTNDLKDLMKRAATLIANVLKSEQAFLFVYYGERHHVQAGTDKHSRLSVQDARTLDEYAEKHDIISLADLEPYDHALKRLLMSYKIAIALPLRRDGRVIGYLNLGDHKQGAYTRRDTGLLDTVADELSIAVQNALSIQEVKELNAHLQQRIEGATKELRASNAQLQKLDEAKDEFISMASHQLRTPLTSIKGYISMLVEGDVGKVTPDQKHLLDEAFISSERMVRLIGDFLNVSRLQTGKFIIERQPIDLAKVVGQEIESLLPNAAARNLKFSYKQPKNFPTLSLDESKIRQVIMNFADNAIYYSKEKSTIKIELTTVGKTVEFTVKDTGIGVPDKEKEKLFGKFFRATNARKQRPDGTGVGLFLAKKVIDAHDGQVIFESKEGKGSTFGFRLPIVKLAVHNAKQLDDKPGEPDNDTKSN
jgi:signal transduction histidine kinase